MYLSEMYLQCTAFVVFKHASVLWLIFNILTLLLYWAYSYCFAAVVHCYIDLFAAVTAADFDDLFG